MAAGRRVAWVGCGLLLAAALACGGQSEEAPPRVPGATLPVVWLEVGSQRVTAEVASAPAARARGLMFRESLPPNHGMLFVFPREEVLGFWMRNTKLPLSIAYADAGGRIVRIADMQPLSEQSVSSLHPARYALEMRQGWFREHGVAEGDRLGGIAELTGE